MSLRVDPRVAAELTQYGGDTAAKCFNCGNCTAACSLTNQDAVFPRRYIRYVQLGLEERMVGSLDPWLCYYCGDCSETCPREAQPGKLMMAGRRWLISKYDWTGLSRLMYRREWTEVVMLALVAVMVVALFAIPANFGFRLLAQHPEARQHVDLVWFAPKEMVHRGDLVLAATLALLLATNAARMVFYVRRHALPARAGDYLMEFREFVIHGLTQRRWRDCEAGAQKHWLRHLFLVSAYATMFVLVVVFLNWFQVQNSSFHWTSLLGYYGTAVLAGCTAWTMYDRRQRREPIHSDSDLADWLFLVLLFLTGVSGIVLHVARLADWPLATYSFYVVHLAIAVPMLVIEVPFGKWSHLVYRPLALYLQAVDHRARQRTTAINSMGGAHAAAA